MVLCLYVYSGPLKLFELFKLYVRIFTICGFPCFDYFVCVLCCSLMYVCMSVSVRMSICSVCVHVSMHIVYSMCACM